MQKARKRPLTMMQRRALKGLFDPNCPTAKEAGKKAGSKFPHTYLYNYLKRPTGQKALADLLEEAGLSDPQLAQLIKEGCYATKVVTVVKQEDGSFKPIEYPDWHARHKYIETGLKGKLLITESGEEAEKAKPQRMILLVRTEGKATVTMQRSVEPAEAASGS